MLGDLIPPVASAGLKAGLRILYFSDIHSQLEPGPPGDSLDPRGGLLHLMEEVETHGQAMIDEGGAVLLVFAGDFLGRESMYGNYQNGTPILKAMRESVAHFAERWGKQFALVTTLGNHEVDSGLPHFLNEFRSCPALPIVCHNLDLDGIAYTADAEIINVGDWKIGVVGIVTDEIVTHAARGFLNTRDPAETAARLIDGLASADLRLAVVHLADKHHDAVAHVTGVDIAIGGHIHARREWRPPGSPAALCVRSGCYGYYLGRIDVRWQDGRANSDHDWVTVAAAELVSDGFAAVRQVIVDSQEWIRDNVASEFAPIGWVEGPMPYSTSRIRSGPAALGATLARWLREAIEWRYQGELHRLAISSLGGAFLNGGNIRNNFRRYVSPGAQLLDEDVVLRAHLRCILPYGNRPAVYVGRRTALTRLVGHSLERLFVPDTGGFLQFDGVSYEVASNGALAALAPAGTDDRVAFATIDYLCTDAHGLDPQTLGFDCHILDKDADIVDVMADWAVEHSFRSGVPIKPAVVNSIVPAAMNPFKVPCEPERIDSMRKDWRDALRASLEGLPP